MPGAVVIIISREISSLTWLGILLALAWLGYALFSASIGIYNIDEAIYVAMIDQFANTGSLLIDNGYDAIAANSLRLGLLRIGPEGLAPQYPSGFAILAAPFYLAGGIRGVILLNSVATILTLWLTFKITMELFKDRRVAVNAALIFGLATFAADYAFAIWPHATANLLVAAAVFAAARSLTDDYHAWLWAALAGLMLGFGVSIRADVIIAAPILFVWLFVNSRSVGRPLLAYLLALTLGLLFAAWLNDLKFGQFNPLTYGTAASSTSGTSLGSYAGYFPYALLAMAAAMSLRWKQFRRLLDNRSGWVLFLLAAIIVEAVPATREMMHKILRGLYVLLIDIESFRNIENYSGADKHGEHYLFFGTSKKPLVHSLPYLGLMVFPLVRSLKSERRWAYAVVALFPLVWFLPFAPTQWFGGFANNMRYFSPVLPMLALAAALGWREINGKNAHHLPAQLAGAIVISLLLMAGWYAANRELGFIEAVFIDGGATYLAAALFLSSLLWLLLSPTESKWFRPALGTLCMASFCLALVAAYISDVPKSQKHRDYLHSLNTQMSYIEDDAHVVSPYVEPFVFQLTRDQATLALFREKGIDADLEAIDEFMRRGRPVYLYSTFVRQKIMRALAARGETIGPGGYTAYESISTADGQFHGLFRLERKATNK